MKLIQRSALGLLLVASIVATTQNEPPQGDDTKIVALENAWNHAEVSKDLKALDSLLAETLVYVDYDGSVMNKAQFLASTKDTSYRPQQIANENVTVHMYGNAAVVSGEYRDKGASNGKPYARHGRFTDTWVFQNGIWRCVASQSTLMRR